MGLVVETEVPFGNACDVAVEEGDGMPVVSFAAHPHGGPECLWFCFRLSQAGSQAASGGMAKLVFKHFNNVLGGSRPASIRPVVKRAGGGWKRLQPGAGETLPDGRCQVTWVIDAPNTCVDLAFCYPYGRQELSALLKEAEGRWRADTIGVSQKGRPLVRLSNGPGKPGGDRPGLYLLARQHSGEVPGSWVLDGFLRHISSCGANAPLTWAVPLANIDGVEEGDYGKDNFPYDLNRAWGQPPMRHETLVVQRDMQRWKGRCAPLLCLDFHAPGASESEGIYSFLPDPEKHPEQHAQAVRWMGLFSKALTPTYAAGSFGRVATYASRWETPTFTSHCCGRQGICGITLEVPYAMSQGTLLTRERYREAGARLAACVVRELTEGKA